MHGQEQEINRPKLAASLRGLAAELQDCQASPEVEARLMDAFRARQAPPAKSRTWWWAGAIAAAVVLLAALGQRQGDRVTPRVSPPQVKVVKVPLPVAGPPSPPAPQIAAIVKPRRRARPKPAAPSVIEAAPPVMEAKSNDDEKFIPLPYAAAVNPAEALDVVRVRLPRSEMIRFGMPVSAERAWEPVNADVVFAQDGMARAIRFVK
jgi:hypothetical protein